VPDVEHRLIEAHGMVSTLLMCKNTDGNCLVDSEKQTINEVTRKLKPLSVSEIIEASHQESGWQKCAETHSYIAYDEAFDLKLL
jgi:uncharacterized phage-associated protein